MKKGIDGTFVQYGIKKEDMQLIEAACMAEGIDSEWVKEYILRPLNLNLHIGAYDNGMDAYLDINNREISNTQMLIAGATGSDMSDMPDGRIDSMASVLMQLVKFQLFADEDKIGLVSNSYIIDLGRCPKEGVYAKAVMYFVISKLYDICEKMQTQASDDDRYEIRHFSVIDEAHYMLRFDTIIKELRIFGYFSPKELRIFGYFS